MAVPEHEYGAEVYLWWILKEKATVGSNAYVLFIPNLH